MLRKWLAVLASHAFRIVSCAIITSNVKHVFPAISWQVANHNVLATLRYPTYSTVMLAPLILRAPLVIRVFTYLQLQGCASLVRTFMLNVRLVVIQTLAQLVALGMDLTLQRYLERLFAVCAISKFQTVTTALKSTIVCIASLRMELLLHCTACTASC